MLPAAVKLHIKNICKFTTIAMFTVLFVSACGGGGEGSGGGGGETSPPSGPGPGSEPGSGSEGGEPGSGSEPDPVAQSCVFEGELPVVSQCNGLSLTDSAAIYEMSAGLATSQGSDGHGIFHFTNEQSITLKNEGCYEFGQKDDEFSISFWLKPYEWPDIERRITNNVTYILGNRVRFDEIPGFNLNIRQDDDSRFWLRLEGHTENSGDYAIASPKLKAGEWHHVVLSYQSRNDTGTFTLHLDTESIKGQSSDSVANGRRLMIGDLGWGDIENFDLSEVIFYDTLLTDSEIRTLYTSNEKSSLSSDTLVASIDRLNQHINRTSVLSDEEITETTDQFMRHRALIWMDENHLQQTFALIENFESSEGGIFTTPRTRYGFTRAHNNTDGFALARNMLLIQQAVHDTVFTNAILKTKACRDILNGKYYASSAFFPGAVAAPQNPNLSHQIKVDATLKPYWGVPVAFSTEPSRRPTGKYLAPGSIAKVTVPNAMVNAGFTVLVGAHTIDHADKPQLQRFDRVFREYPITANEVHVANPFGGGIYINVPYTSDLDIQTINIENVVQAPFYSTKDEHKTTLTQWQENRNSAAPWADFETDNFMMQVPTNWIYAMEDPAQLMENWTKAMDGVTEFRGMTPEERNRKVLYVQNDIRMAHSMGHGIGYPQANQIYNPDQDANGMSSHHFVTDPVENYILYHELGHAEGNLSGFHREGEAIVNFLSVYVREKKFGWDFEEAFRNSRGDSNLTTEVAAANWMVTPNFRNGREMDKSGSAANEIRYQHRGYAKYGDIVKLFGWPALQRYYRKLGEEAMAADVDQHGLSTIDYKFLKLSEGADWDLTPLIHFWGIHPEDPTALQAAMLQHGLHVSPAVQELLQHYADIAPKNNEEFLDHYDLVYPGRPNNEGDLIQNMYAELSNSYDESTNAEIRASIQSIIDLYYN